MGSQWVLLGLTGFQWVFTRFNWFSMGFTGFCWVSMFFLGFNGFSMGLTGFDWVSLGLTGFNLGFYGFDWVWLGFNGFYWVLLGGRGAVGGTWVSRCRGARASQTVVADVRQAPAETDSCQLFLFFLPSFFLPSFLFWWPSFFFHGVLSWIFWVFLLSLPIVNRFLSVLIFAVSMQKVVTEFYRVFFCNGILLVIPVRVFTFSINFGSDLTVST